MVKALIVLFVIIPLIGFTQSKDDMVGIWQDNPFVASGWSDTYLFYADGNYEFHFNQMNCDNRLLSIKGIWKLEKDGSLVLIENSNTILEGGTLVPSSGSCASEYSIEGGEIITKLLPDSVSYVISISKIITDEENNSLKTMVIGNKRYWRISKEPRSYY